jgi:hypothetical protein
MLLVTECLNLSDQAASIAPQAAKLLAEAAVLLTAAHKKLAPGVDALAISLRSKLPKLDYDQSVKVATDLLMRFGDGDEVTEAALPWGQVEKRKGPDPDSSGKYQPGQAAWW